MKTKWIASIPEDTDWKSLRYSETYIFGCKCVCAFLILLLSAIALFLYLNEFEVIGVSLLIANAALVQVYAPDGRLILERCPDFPFYENRENEQTFDDVMFTKGDRDMVEEILIAAVKVIDAIYEFGPVPKGKK